MIPLYSNGAVTKLSADITSADTSITVVSTAKFPTIVAGTSYFTLTLVGNVTSDVEIVQVTEVNANVLTVVRGYQSTTPTAFVTLDQAYHGITRDDASSFRDAMEYYLGPQVSDPVVARYGQPLQAGMLYYNTSNSITREYDGTVWRQFATVISIAGLSEYLWDSHATIAAGGPVVWSGGTDEQGQTQPDISANDLVQVYIDGIRLQDGASGNIAGQFEVVTGTPGNVTINDGATSPFRLTVVVGVNSTADYIDRTEADASGFGFTVAEDDMVSDSPALLPTQKSVKAYVDATYTGSKNLLINPHFRINQRGASKLTGVARQYGFDRWRDSQETVGNIEQGIEAANLVDGEQYTLSWEAGAGTSHIYDSLHNLIDAGASPLAFTYAASQGVIWISTPSDTTVIQLEAGPRESNFETRQMQAEFAMCHRYYLNESNVTKHMYMSSTNTVSDNLLSNIDYPVIMRAPPTVTLGAATGLVGANPTQGSITESGFYVTGKALDMTINTFYDGFIADSEIV